MNARFWIFENDGFIKLTLRPGQSLEWARGGATDEGYACHGFRVELVADTVVMAEWSDAGDCDGRFGVETVRECHVSRLNIVPIEVGLDVLQPEEGGLAPDWQRVTSSQRDQFAEAAGY